MRIILVLYNAYTKHIHTHTHTHTHTHEYDICDDISVVFVLTQPRNTPDCTIQLFLLHYLFCNNDIVCVCVCVCLFVFVMVYVEVCGTMKLKHIVDKVKKKRNIEPVSAHRGANNHNRSRFVLLWL
jgi:hypothetical protein